MNAAHSATFRPRRWPAILTVLAGLLYGVSPIDLIPDLVPLLGWSDDVAVMLTAAILAFRFLRGRSRGDRVRVPERPPLSR